MNAALPGAAPAMRRLLIGNKYFFRKGGAETYLFDLFDELPARGWELVQFSMQHERNEPTPYAPYFVDKVDYHEHGSLIGEARAAMRLLYSNQARANMERLVRDTRPHLAHLHNIYHQISPSILPVLKRHGVPVVMTLHDLKLACPNYKMRTGGKICERCLGGDFYQAVVHRCVQDSRLKSALCALEAYLARWTRVYLDNVDLFITPSEFYRRKLIEGGVPAQQLVTLASFVHPEQYTPRYDKGDYFLYLGRLSEEKGIMSLVRAAAGLPGKRLLIAGEGPMQEAIEALLRAQHVSNVELVGMQSGQALIELIRGARCVVVPSEWYENCPRSAIEAMACGTPVIGADIGGIPDMVEDGVTGLLFEAFSVDALRAAILRLHDDDDLIAELGRNARAKVEQRYSIGAHLEQLLAIYDRVAGRVAPP